MRSLAEMVLRISKDNPLRSYRKGSCDPDLPGFVHGVLLGVDRERNDGGGDQVLALKHLERHAVDQGVIPETRNVESKRSVCTLGSRLDDQFAG